jgi:formate transporter
MGSSPTLPPDTPVAAQLEPASDGHRVAASSLDALLPAAMAAKAADIGATKANMDAVRTVTLGVLAGAFIALGAAFATTNAAGAAGALPLGVTDC